MGNLTGFRADIDLADRLLAQIERAVEDSAEDGFRGHLGASIIGRKCDRDIWSSFRWITHKKFEGRMLRLFARGHREEDSLSDYLRAAGCEVVQIDPKTGQQFTFGTGHFGGSMDGAVHGLPESKKWHVVDFKTANKKSFDKLESAGLEKGKPEHFAQLQMYMAWSGMERALYMVVCKDDDRLYLERIAFSRKAADKYQERADMIIASDAPPARISDDPAWFECKFCDHSANCHGDAAPVPTCRSCVHVSITPAGWHCEEHNRSLRIDEQKAGCADHLYHPQMVKNWATATDSDPKANAIHYKTSDGREFTNGKGGVAAGPGVFTSIEIYNAADKRALVDDEAKTLRAEFGAEVIG